MRILGLLLVVGIAGGLYAWSRGGQPELHPDDPRLATGEAGIVMLAAEWCGYCRKQQGDFERAGVRYRVLDIDNDDGDRAMRALGARGVPVTVIGQAVSQVRGAKSSAQVSMRTDVACAVVRGPAPDLDLLRAAADDLAAAGRISELVFESAESGELVVEVSL